MRLTDAAPRHIKVHPEVCECVFSCKRDTHNLSRSHAWDLVLVLCNSHGTQRSDTLPSVCLLLASWHRQPQETRLEMFQPSDSCRPLMGDHSNQHDKLCGWIKGARCNAAQLSSRSGGWCYGTCFSCDSLVGLMAPRIRSGLCAAGWMLEPTTRTSLISWFGCFLSTLLSNSLRSHSPTTPLPRFLCARAHRSLFSVIYHTFDVVVLLSIPMWILNHKCKIRMAIPFTHSTTTNVQQHCSLSLSSRGAAISRHLWQQWQNELP